MGIFKRKPEPPAQSPKDPRDPVGKNPTERARRSSAGKRRQEANRLEKDLKGSRWEKKGNTKKDEGKK